MSVPATVVTKKLSKTRKHLKAQFEEMLRLREEMTLLNQALQSQTRQIAQLESIYCKKKISIKGKLNA